MIATLRGTLLETNGLEAVIEAAGVGYAVSVPLTTVERLPRSGQPVFLYTHAIYREDAAQLFGFATREDREFFRQLIEKVSGIGPKLALTIMSRLSLPVLRTAVAAGDVALLSKCPGIGKKTAERLVVELRDKVGLPTAGASPVEGSSSPVGGENSTPAETAIADAVAALITLGYKPPDADRAIRKVAQGLTEEPTTEVLIKKALGAA
jgi:holliday junction DNA helicase RuvA